MTESSLTYMKKVLSITLEEKDSSLFGSMPQFPWDSFSEKLASILNVTYVKISPGNIGFKSKENILKGLGTSPLSVSFELSPLEDHFTLLIPSEDFGSLSQNLISDPPHTQGITNPYLQKGFLKYLSLFAIEAITQLEFIPKLTPKVIDQNYVNVDAYCVDIAIEVGSQTIWGRMAFAKGFQKALKNHYSQPWSFSTPSSLYKNVPVFAPLIAGSVALTVDEFHTIKKGDFLILDHSSYNPNTNKGSLQLSFENEPLFYVKIKNNTLKILDYASLTKENTMDEITDSSSPEQHTKDITVEEASTSQIVSPSKVPVNITVEVARLKMSLDQLLKIKPGNVIELGADIDKQVNLSANGQVVGRGELLQVGEVIGIKITTIGE